MCFCLSEKMRFLNKCQIVKVIHTHTHTPIYSPRNMFTHTINHILHTERIKTVQLLGEIEQDLNNQYMMLTIISDCCHGYVQTLLQSIRRMDLIQF